MNSLLPILLEQLTPERRQRLEEVLGQRTYRLGVVLEDIFQGHNAAAVLRSCECFGVQKIHCIETRNKFQPNDEVSMGAGKWLTLERWANTPSCMENLKKQGYQIVALTLREPSVPLADVPLEKPTALVFGTEDQGLSDIAHQYADIHAHLPMVGFTQSFNISVSVALSLQTLMPKIRARNDWQLTSAQADELRLEWLKGMIPHWEMLEKRYCQ